MSWTGREELMRTYDARRRHILMGAMGVLVSACERRLRSLDPVSGSTPAAVDASLSADFAFPNGETVRLDYLNKENFRLQESGQSAETLAIEGQIYLHIRSQDGRTEQLWQYGALDRRPRASSGAALPKVRPTLIPPQGIAHWGIKTDVYDVTTSAEGVAAASLDATIAKLPALAHAQWAVATSLLPAMDMSLCGDGVQLVTRSWKTELTSQGWAVLATSDGFRLDGPVQNLALRPSLPQGIPVRAYPRL